MKIRDLLEVSQRDSDRKEKELWQIRSEDDAWALQCARLSNNKEDYIRRVIPSWLKQRKPENHYIAYKDGEAVAAFGEDALPRYANRSDFTIKIRKPSWQSIKKYENYCNLVKEYLEKYDRFEAEDLLSWFSINQCQIVIVKYIMKAIGANRWRPIQSGSETFETGFGGRGVEIKIPSSNSLGYNVVFLDIGIENGTVYMSQIAILDKSGGIGTQIMNALHQYCIQNRCRLVVYKVTNRNFYLKFPWLKTKGHDFVFDPFMS